MGYFWWVVLTLLSLYVMVILNRTIARLRLQERGLYSAFMHDVRQLERSDLTPHERQIIEDRIVRRKRLRVFKRILRYLATFIFAFLLINEIFCKVFHICLLNPFGFLF